MLELWEAKLSAACRGLYNYYKHQLFQNYSEVMILPFQSRSTLQASLPVHQHLHLQIWLSLQLLQTLAEKFTELAKQEVAADNLYEACIAFAQVSDTSDEWAWITSSESHMCFMTTPHTLGLTAVCIHYLLARSFFQVLTQLRMSIYSIHVLSGHLLSLFSSFPWLWSWPKKVSMQCKSVKQFWKKPRSWDLPDWTGVRAPNFRIAGSRKQRRCKLPTICAHGRKLKPKAGSRAVLLLKGLSLSQCECFSLVILHIPLFCICKWRPLNLNDLYGTWISSGNDWPPSIWISNKPYTRHLLWAQ